MSELQVQQLVRKKITWGENDRRYIEKQSLEDLACTIRVHGILEAIGVKPEGDHYIGLWGHRRWMAAEIAGLETVPAVVCAKSMTESYADRQTSRGNPEFLTGARLCALCSRKA
jgi:ParB/RepB/Spo0J family partition protein